MSCCDDLGRLARGGLVEKVVLPTTSGARKCRCPDQRAEELVELAHAGLGLSPDGQISW
jgi:hypothetical protein